MGARRLQQQTAKKIRLFPTYTPLYYWTRDTDARYVVHQGGTSSSKTVSILQRLIKLAITASVTITVVAATADSFKRGALRDFKDLLKVAPNVKQLIINPKLVKGPYVFKNGSIIEFVNLDDPEKAKHGKRDYLFLNEANSIDYEAAKQLIVRTAKQVYIDYNSDARFWVHDEIILRHDADFFISNFKHNRFAAKAVIADLLEYKRKYEETKLAYWKNKWEVYGLGLTGVTEGVVFQNINYVKYMPLGLKYRAYALDFGFSNDPTALALCGVKNGRIYAKELLYETGLTTPDLIKKLRSFGITKKDIIVADSANPDAIAQIHRAGFRIVPAKKGPGSRDAGIDALRGFNIYLTNDSENWKIEQENFKFLKVKGAWSNKIVDGYDHLFDALRYWYQYWFPSDVKKRRKKHRRQWRKV